MIKLYGVSQSRTMRSLWMLEELGLPYENVKTNFRTGDTRKPDFLRLNPKGHIPVLQDGDVTLWESMAINLYGTTRACGRSPSRTRAARSSGASGP
jgi:glutathione S-transferase